MSVCGFQARFFTLDSWHKNFRRREMPVVNITWLEGRTVDQKRKVAQRITQVLMEEAGAKSESTHIVMVDVPATNFASGGVTVADKRRSA
jgi:4-oxalocrotonate tautomerase